MGFQMPRRERIKVNKELVNEGNSKLRFSAISAFLSVALYPIYFPAGYAFLILSMTYFLWGAYYHSKAIKTKMGTAAIAFVVSSTILMLLATKLPTNVALWLWFVGLILWLSGWTMAAFASAIANAIARKKAVYLGSLLYLAAIMLGTIAASIPFLVVLLLSGILIVVGTRERT